jgi:hypothetical protein
MEKNIDAAVGMTRKWDAREAGREVARDTIQQLSAPPSFFILFSTIHYKDNGGFEEFLKGVWDVLPEGTPLIGGTVAGFMNQFGCFTRGATSLAVYSEGMDVEIGLGHNTKRNPKKAVDECLSNFKKLDDNNNQFIFEIVSGAEIPNFPRIGRQSVIKSKSAGETSIKLLPLISRLNMGADRADEILDNIVDLFKSSKLIGMTCMDDRKFIHNYQFFDKEVLENALCLMKLNCNMKCDLNTSFGLVEKQEDTFDFELNPDMRLVQKINGKKATEELFNIVGIDKDNVRMLDKFYSQSFYYPFGCYSNDFIHACIVSGILGEKIYFANQADQAKLKLFQLTGKQILKSTEELFSSFSNDLNLNLMIMCETYIETLGGQIYKIYDMIKNKVNNPFLVLFVGGESVSYGDGVPHYLYESLNSLTVKN